MFNSYVKWVVAVLCLAYSPLLAFAADERMQVDVLADQHRVEVSWLHANMQKAAALALPQLWDRIIPQSAHGLIPKRVNALQFLQKASPTASGVRIIFHQKRVMAYLKKHDLPYIAAQAGLHPVQANADPAVSQAALTPAAAPVAAPQTNGPQIHEAPLGATAGLPKQAVELHLHVMRQASLAEQVLFEHELQQDSRILNLSLRQVNQEGQQYRLQLKGADDQWLTAWFARRGMTLKPTIEGWVAR